MLFETVEDLDAGDRLARHQGDQEGFDRFFVYQAEDFPDPFGRQGSRVRRQELVEHRFGVAHAAGRQARNQVDCFGLGSATIGIEDHLQLAGNLGDGQAPEVEPLDARQDRRADAAAVRGAEDEDRVVGRLLESLEEHVPALGDALDLVDDEDLAAQVRRRGEDARQQLAHVADGVVGGGVEFLDVQCPAIANGHAGRAYVTWLAVVEISAVDRLGQDAGKRSLACAARTDEEVGVGGPAGTHAVAQRLDDGFLTDDLLEGLGSPASIDCLMRHRTHGTPAGGSEKGQPVDRVDRPGSRAPCTLLRSVTSAPTASGSSDQAEPRHPAIIV